MVYMCGRGLIGMHAHSGIYDGLEGVGQQAFFA